MAAGRQLRASTRDEHVQIENIDVEDRRIAVHAPETNGGRAKYTDESGAYCLSICVQDAGRNVRVVKNIVTEREDIEVPQLSVFNCANRGNWQEQERELYHSSTLGYNHRCNGLYAWQYKGIRDGSGRHVEGKRATGRNQGEDRFRPH